MPKNHRRDMYDIVSRLMREVDKTNDEYQFPEGAKQMQYVPYDEYPECIGCHTNISNQWNLRIRQELQLLFDTNFKKGSTPILKESITLLKYLDSIISSELARIKRNDRRRI